MIVRAFLYHLSKAQFTWDIFVHNIAIKRYILTNIFLLCELKIQIEVILGNYAYWKLVWKKN